MNSGKFSVIICSNSAAIMVKTKERRTTFDYSCNQTQHKDNGKVLNFSAWRFVYLGCNQILFFYSGIVEIGLNCTKKATNAENHPIVEEATHQCYNVEENRVSLVK